LKGAIQQFIDVYVSQATFAEVERAFPYMVAREFASGGGDVRNSQYDALVTDISRFRFLNLSGIYSKTRYLSTWQILEFS
jgi:hypothetical protein